LHSTAFIGASPRASDSVRPASETDKVQTLCYRIQQKKCPGVLKKHRLQDPGHVSDHECLWRLNRTPSAAYFSAGRQDRGQSFSAALPPSLYDGLQYDPTFSTALRLGRHDNIFCGGHVQVPNRGHPIARPRQMFAPPSLCPSTPPSGRAILATLGARMCRCQCFATPPSRML
jgi:hypothetical protein